jgi:hypothetical protein
VICTGDGDSTALREDPGSTWYFRNVEHLVMMTRQFAGRLSVELKLELKVYEPCTNYDTAFLEKVRQYVQHFAFHQFRRKTLLSRFISFVPVIRRASKWCQPPTLSCTTDHVVVVLFKQPSTAKSSRDDRSLN